MLYGVVEKSQKTIKLTNLPKNYNASVLSSKSKYLHNFNDTEFQRSLINAVQTKEDFSGPFSF